MSMDRLFSVFRISGSGLAAQRKLIEVTASNIANVETTKTEEGGPYIPKRLRFEEKGLRNVFGRMVELEMNRQNIPADIEGLVDVAEVNQEETPVKQVYDPENPDADENGFVHKPNINLIKEMSNMMLASRSYEANVTVMDAAKAMMKKALEI